jgi:hypothetical protein
MSWRAILEATSQNNNNNNNNHTSVEHNHIILVHIYCQKRHMTTSMEQQQVTFGFARSAYACGAFLQCIAFLASLLSYNVKLFTELLFIDRQQS